MSHLSPAEIVDAADGRLPAARAAHLDACADCAGRLSGIRAAAAAAQDFEAPEPSPLYWQQLSARIRDRVAEETIVPAWRATPWRERFALGGLVPVASAVALVAAVFVVGLVRQAPGDGRGASMTAATTASAEPILEPDDSDIWNALTSAAADVPLDDAHAAGMAVSAGAVDDAVQRLSPAELNELNRLLQTELGGRGN